MIGGRLSRASDHADGASIATDPPADIGDVFAFMRPSKAADAGPFVPSTHLALALTVHPGATSTTLFDERIDYTLNVIGVDDPANGIPGKIDVAVICRFFAPVAPDGGGAAQQPFTCSANGFFFQGRTNEISGAPSDPIRVFAGLRADPAFGDVPAVLSAIGAGNVPSPDGGTNGFAGKNVLAIVAEINVSQVVLGGEPSTVLGVSATTERQP
jgi:hypothetical protein